ncbi:hypothetical protein EMCRGX_G007951 [Ephydatia muelleri]
MHCSATILDVVEPDENNAAVLSDECFSSVKKEANDEVHVVPDLPEESHLSVDQSSKLKTDSATKLNIEETSDQCGLSRDEAAFKLEVAVRKIKAAERKEAFDKMSEQIKNNYGDGYSGCVDAVQQQYWIKDFLLYDSDKTILESHTARINASIIDASQTLLAHKFNHFYGFQTVGCGYSMNFCKQRKGFVQILYDEQIACIVNAAYPRIKLNFMDVTCQNGSDDCGLFAVAYATTICYGKKPEKFIFDQGLMRRHLLKCLENKLMEEFPVRKERRISDKVINPRRSYGSLFM